MRHASGGTYKWEQDWSRWPSREGQSSMISRKGAPEDRARVLDGLRQTKHGTIRQVLEGGEWRTRCAILYECVSCRRASIVNLMPP